MKKIVSIMLCILLIMLTNVSVLAYSIDDCIEPIPLATKLTTYTPFTQTGGSLIFVDMPEVLMPFMTNQPDNGMFIGTWASYREEVNGRFRLMYYHQNHGNKDLYYSIALSNTTNHTIKVFWNRIGIGEDLDAAKCGSQITKEWLDKSTNDTFWGYIPAGKTKYFTIRKVNDRYTGEAIIDFNITDMNGNGDTAKVTTVISDVSPNNDPSNGIDNASILSIPVLPWVTNYKGDIVGITRGKWNSNTRESTINYNGTTGNRYINLGNDPRWGSEYNYLLGEKEVGYSSVDNKQVENYGNYGIDYKLNINLSNPWSGYSKIDMIFTDPVHEVNLNWFYAYFAGKVGNQIKVSPRWVNSRNRGYVFFKGNPGTYNLETQVVPGSDHPMQILFCSDN